jgi:hypothetical protein
LWRLFIVTGISSDDFYVPEAIESLIGANVPFVEMEKRGIKWLHFGSALVTSGMVCLPHCKWIVFNGWVPVTNKTHLTFFRAWDLGFVMRTMLRRKLDAEADKYNELLHMFFKVCSSGHISKCTRLQTTYDIRMLAMKCPNVDVQSLDFASLHELAKQFDVCFQHFVCNMCIVLQIDTSDFAPMQSGSDAQLVGLTFFEIKKVCWQACCTHSAFSGSIRRTSSIDWRMHCLNTATGQLPRP